jgi:hypothetical protein
MPNPKARFEREFKKIVEHEDLFLRSWDKKFHYVNDRVSPAIVGTARLSKTGMERLKVLRHEFTSNKRESSRTTMTEHDKNVILDAIKEKDIPVEIVSDGSEEGKSFRNEIWEMLYKEGYQTLTIKAATSENFAGNARLTIQDANNPLNGQLRYSIKVNPI